MNELQRLSYLRSMGYQAYYPRFVLPGAKESPRYQELRDALSAQAKVSAEAKVSSDTKTQSSQPPLRPGNSAAKAMLEAGKSSALADKKKPAPKPAATTITKTEEAGDELRFSLRYFAVNKRLAVISEEPHQLKGMQSRDSMSLLRAILLALSPVVESEELRGEEFNWPIAKGLSAGDPKRAASLALRGFINQRQEQDGFDNLLVFTAQLAAVLGEDVQAENYGDIELSELNCKATLTHSLQSMLVHPLLKREVWAHLQPLRQRLSA